MRCFPTAVVVLALTLSSAVIRFQGEARASAPEPAPWPPSAGPSPEGLARLAVRARKDRAIRCALDVLAAAGAADPRERRPGAPTFENVRAWLACGAPAGQRPIGPPAPGAPCSEGGARRWQVLEAGHDGLVWVGDLVGSTPTEVHLVAALPPDTTRLSLRGAADRIEVVVSGQGPADATRLVFGPVDHAAEGQYGASLAAGPDGADRAGEPVRLAFVRLTPAPHTTARFGLGLNTRAPPPGPSPVLSPLLSEGEPWRALLASLEGPASLPEALVGCPSTSWPALALAVDRALGRPDGERLLEDVLLAVEGGARDLDMVLLALTQVRRIEAREAILGLLGAGGAASPDMRHALAALALDGGHVARAVFVLGARGWDPRHDALAARISLARGRPEDAVALLSRCRGPVACDPATMALLGEALRGLGLEADATALGAPSALTVEALVAAADAAPSRARLRIEAARRLAEVGRSPEGRALLAPLRAHGGYAARVISTDSRVALAETLEALGDETDARTLADAALADAPDDSAAALLVDRLSGETWSPPLGPWREAFGALGEAALEPFEAPDAAIDWAAAAPPLTTGAAWEVLEEHTLIDVADDGSVRRLGRRLLRAGPVEAGSRRALRWPWDPSRVDLRLLRADILPQGAPAGRRPLRGRRVEAGELTLGLYADERVLVQPVDEVQEGDLVELLWRVTPTPERFPGYVEVVEKLTDRLPRHRSVTHLRLPVALGATWRVSPDPLGVARIETSTLTRASAHLVTVKLGATPGIPGEPWAPPIAELSATLTVSGVATWDALAAFYAQVLQREIVVTPAMAARVAEVVEAHRRADGTPDKRAIAEALAAEVATRVRYVGLEFGIHGYRPYRTDDVWARRYGDCKDQALLLVALLAKAGIDAEPVLVRTRRLGGLPGAPGDVLPLLAHFDHAMVYLRDTDRFIDVTAPHHGLASLPAANQGAVALRVPLDGAPGTALRALPFAGPSMNGATGDFAVIVEPTGRAVVQGRVRYRGVQAGTWRLRLSDAASREQRVQTMIATSFPGFRLGHVTVDGLAFGDSQLSVTFDGDVPRLALPTENHTLSIETPLPLGGQRRRLGDPAQRRLAFVLGPPSGGAFEIAWTFPAGTKVSLPPRFELAEGAVKASVEWRLTEGAGPVTATGRVQLEFIAERVAAEGFDALAAALGAFDAAVATPLLATLPMGAP